MTQPLSAHGTLLQLGASGGGGPYTTIAEVVDISGPSFSQSTFDAPSQDTTWMKRVAGIVTGGEVSFTINFIPKDATHDDSTGILSALGSLDVYGYKLVFNDAGTGTASAWTFDAFITGFEHNEPVDGILQADCTLTLNGQPVFAKGTS
jgi:hypothetical protein